MTVDDSRVMPGLEMVCPDCRADVGEACHPDCSTFWTEEEESMNTERVSAGMWVQEYVGFEGLTLDAFRQDFDTLRPVYRAMRGITDRQAWLDEYSRIQWESSARRQASGEALLTVDAGELSSWLAEEDVYICRECKSAECGAQKGRLLVRISKTQYETRENVCPRCDRIETFCNCEDY